MKVPSAFWVTDWYGSDGATLAARRALGRGAGDVVADVVQRQMPLGSTSVMVIAELSVYSPESTCSV